jgi:hypothetical protein
MKKWSVVAALLLTVFGNAQDLGKLPQWAETAARAVVDKPIPEGDAWVVLNRTEIAYTGDGEIRTCKFRLVKILRERGLDEAGYWLGGLGGKASKINKLKGWNLRPDNELVKLKDDTVLSTDTSNSERVSTSKVTVAVLPRAMKGSWIAFESQETVQYPTGPVDKVSLMEEHPIHRWELEVAKKEGWFTNLKQVAIRLDVRHFEPWLKNAQIEPEQGVRVSDLPPLPRDEGAVPYATDTLPWVLVRFQDPNLLTAPSAQSWDAMAKWYYEAYAGKCAPQSVTGISGKDAVPALPAIHHWMSRQMTYRQVYLSPERGWIPERAEEVARKRYGDCKDLANLFVSEARALGFKAFPVLSRIGHGTAHADDPVFAGNFNHVIAAIRLEKSLGLSAELDIPTGRFLLVDATDRLSPFGVLPWDHRERELLICTEKGGVWVKVPVSATQRPVARYWLEGKVWAKGELDATLRIQEEADGVGLRQACLNLGPQKMKEFVLNNLLDLPPTGTVEVVSLGDPLDLDKPFEISLKFQHPDGFHLQGAEGVLVPWGLPSSPNPIQKPGTTRQFPVQFRGAGLWEYEAKIQVPWKVTPVLANQTIETAFRNAQWKAEANPTTLGSLIHIRFNQQRRDVFFGYQEREKGLVEWKKDRSQIRTLLADGLSFTFVR